MGSPPARGWRC